MVQVLNVGPAVCMRMLSVSECGSHSLAICDLCASAQECDVGAVQGVVTIIPSLPPHDQYPVVQVLNVGPAVRMRMLSVSAGGSHSLAICENGELWACGRGRHGQLGFGNFDDATTLRPITSLRY